MTKIQEMLFELQDREYAIFQQKLTPTLPLEKFIGVRVPDARKLAKQLSGTDIAADFIDELPHEYFDENMLHGLVISGIKDYDECIRRFDEFLPYVDNWAVCDIPSPKIFSKNRDKLMDKILQWISSDEPYTCRFGMGMLMSHYLDDDFKPEYLEIPAKVHSDEYYVRMMQAWYYATALAKQWDSTIPYMEQQRLDKWVHNKTIQKARESYRITKEQKEYLKGLKMGGRNESI